MDQAKVVKEELTDGSIAYNVEVRADGGLVRIAATSKQRADTLAKKLNEASWIEVEGRS